MKRISYKAINSVAKVTSNCNSLVTYFVYLRDGSTRKYRTHSILNIPLCVCDFMKNHKEYKLPFYYQGKTAFIYEGEITT